MAADASSRPIDGPVEVGYPLGYSLAGSPPPTPAYLSPAALGGAPFLPLWSARSLGAATVGPHTRTWPSHNYRSEKLGTMSAWSIGASATRFRRYKPVIARMSHKCFAGAAPSRGPDGRVVQGKPSAGEDTTGLPDSQRDLRPDLARTSTPFASSAPTTPIDGSPQGVWWAR